MFNKAKMETLIFLELLSDENTCFILQKVFFKENYCYEHSSMIHPASPQSRRAVIDAVLGRTICVNIAIPARTVVGCVDQLDSSTTHYDEHNVIINSGPFDFNSI